VWQNAEGFISNEHDMTVFNLCLMFKAVVWSQGPTWQKSQSWWVDELNQQPRTKHAEATQLMTPQTQYETNMEKVFKSSIQPSVQVERKSLNQNLWILGLFGTPRKTLRRLSQKYD